MPTKSSDSTPKMPSRDENPSDAEELTEKYRRIDEHCSSGSLKLLDMPSSPDIEEYQSEIIKEYTQTDIEEGQVYQDKQTVAAAMKHFSVVHKFQFKVKRSSHRSYWLVCVGENCKWHFKATSINDSAMFKIRSFNRQHTCSLMEETFIQRKRTAAVVGSMVIPKYCDPKTVYTPKDIQTGMLAEHGVNLSYMQAWRTKEKALQFLRGNPADSYSKLSKYFYILEETYPGSHVKLKKTADECFLCAFVALSTSISGWQHCRPAVVVDGTFLKSAYRGIMLTASTMNAADLPRFLGDLGDKTPKSKDGNSPTAGFFGLVFEPCLIFIDEL
ncbi:PREDICTED: uncharacterized protein LOC109207986 [Nicotiana attenuata]|uniref:uncharacterized protein LOC109207986 n=1 Tax=Nicotiana attenuata TaxID=49451 RepID=UPI0009047F44|nr:PREDICTED: uncharacterized protein LOC109207986 [Nicotiana attenuata]